MPSALAELVKYTLLIIGALFPIVNPIGTAPLFLTLTPPQRTLKCCDS